MTDHLILGVVAVIAGVAMCAVGAETDGETIAAWIGAGWCFGIGYTHLVHWFLWRGTEEP